MTLPRDLFFPLTEGTDGSLRELTDPHERVRQKLYQVLFTVPGERVRRPTFGAGLKRLVFAPANALTANSAQAVVTQAVDRYLSDEISLIAVETDIDESDGRAALLIKIVYRRRTERDPTEATFLMPMESPA